MPFTTTTAGWGRNNEQGSTDACFIESDYALRRMSVFGRAEYVDKTGAELALAPANRKIPVKQFSLGAIHELVTGQPYQLGLGAEVTYSIKPDDLDPLYGRHPVGYWIFLRLRSAAMNH